MMCRYPVLLLLQKLPEFSVLSWQFFQPTFDSFSFIVLFPLLFREPSEAPPPPYLFIAPWVLVALPKCLIIIHVSCYFLGCYSYLIECCCFSISALLHYCSPFRLALILCGVKWFCSSFGLCWSWRGGSFSLGLWLLWTLHWAILLVLLSDIKLHGCWKIFHQCHTCCYQCSKNTGGKEL